MKKQNEGAVVHSTPRNVGRPSTYTEDIPERLIDYFTVDINDVIKHNFTTAIKSNYRIEMSAFPQFGRFCQSIGVNPVTFRSWINPKSHLTDEQRTELLAAYAYAKQAQADLLAEMGMYGVSGTFPIFMLKCQHGWVETNELKIGGDGDKPVRLTVVTAKPQSDEPKDDTVDWGDD